MMESDRPHVLREMMYVCRPGGILSIPGVYGGLVDKIPFGAHTANLSDGSDLYKTFRDKKDGCIKVVLKP